MKKSRTIIISCAIAACLITTTAQAALHKDSFQLDNATITSVHTVIKTHKLTCVELITRYLTRIKINDLSLTRGAPINAFVALNANVLSQANELDRYYARTGRFLGPMHCIPVVVKDNIDTVDTPSTSGSLSMLGSQPNTNAFLVNKLRKAGALILGKGAMDEFVSGMNGISSKSGRVGNAYDPNENPGGSSSGPAAAVSANFAMIGIGTDNSGSVRIPAAFNGIYGLRPSAGLISQTGIFPRGNLDGVAGPMARTVKDLAITLSVIANAPDPNDPKTQLEIHRRNTYTNYLIPDALEHKRIGIITSVGREKTFDKNSKPAMKIFDKTFQNLQKFGATLVRVKLPQFNGRRENNMAGEIQDINDYLKSFPSTRQNFRDICKSGRTQVFNGVKECLKHIKETAKKNSRTYHRTLKMFLANRNYVENIMNKNKLDALIMPINSHGAASYDDSGTNTGLGVSSNSGLPAITIIGGYTKAKPAMPVGLELIGKMYGEGELIALAYSYESHFTEKHSPKILAPTKPSPLLNMSIPQMNNLFTLIGYDAYNQYLKNSNTQMIKAKQFAALVKLDLSKNIGKSHALQKTRADQT